MIINSEYRDVGFGTYAGIRLQRGDPELWVLMKQAGWRFLMVAPESGSRATLKRMKKGLNPDIIPGVVQQIRDAGLKVHANFILGYPGDTEADIRATEQLIRKCRFDHLGLYHFQPLPGTPIFDELVATGEISSDLIPGLYSSVNRVYTPEGLKDFNFSRFIIKQYLAMLFHNPLSAWETIHLFNFKYVATRISRIFFDIFPILRFFTRTR